MSENKHLQHIRSSVSGKAPESEQILYGEIAVNYADGNEKLYIRNSSDEVVPFSPFNPLPDDIIVSYMENDLSMMDIYGEKLSYVSTSNCYVVNKSGQYCLPLVYGNAIDSGFINTAAYTKVTGTYSHDFVNYLGNQITSPFIETDTGATASEAILTMADTDGIFTDISIIDSALCKYIQFNVASVPATGANGIISVKDASGVIMWSWHIWVWPDSLETVTITNKTGYDYDILPVNLGSKWETSSAEPTKMKNWYYQWGRPNPMPLASAYNSGTEPTLYGTYTSLTSTTYASDFQTGIKNPNVFYQRNSSGTSNWFGSQSYYNLWDANCTATGTADNTTVKTIYDPSPVGFKVPNGNTFRGFTTTGSNTTSASQFNVVGSFSNGWYFKKNSSDSTGVFFPASGYRSHIGGDFDYVGSSGNYWSSAANSQNYACRLYFYSSGVYPLGNDYRAQGSSVRCVKDTNSSLYNEYDVIPTMMSQLMNDSGYISKIDAGEY